MVRYAAAVLAAVAAAFLFAALTPVALTAPFDHRPVALVFTFVGSLWLTGLLALPAFLVVRSVARVGLKSCLIGGAGIGAIPFTVLGVLGLFGADRESDAGGPLVIDHVPTWHGIAQTALFIAEMTAVGIASAFVFWLVLAVCRALPAINRDMSVKPRGLVAAGLLAVAVALSGLIFSLPALTMDRSCHNLLRDRTDAAPFLSMRLTIPRRDWPKLRTLATGFSASHRLSFRDEGRAYRLLQLSLCTEPGYVLKMEEESHDIGMATDAPAPLPVSAVLIEVYVECPYAPWRTLTRDFVRALDTAWPGQLTVSGDEGKTLPRPKWLEPGR